MTRLRIQPTRFGLKGLLFYAMLWCAFYAAPYLNLFFLLLSFLSVFGVLNVWWGWLNMRGVQGSVRELRPFPAGTEAIVHVELHSKGRRHGLSLDLKLDGHWYRGLTYSSSLAQDATADGLLPPLGRGIYAIQQACVRSCHPFGVVSVIQQLDCCEELVVFPEPMDLSSFRDRNDLASALGSLGGTNTLERGPAGLREYRDGDELRDVHWKASARRGDLVVKEYEGDTAQGLEVQLDLRSDEDALEQALSLIAALAIDAKEQKELMTLTSQNHTGTYGKGHKSFDHLWRYLAEVTALPADAPPPPPVAHGALRLPATNFMPIREAAAVEVGA